jgi:hypothetical protein
VAGSFFSQPWRLRKLSTVSVMETYALDRGFAEAVTDPGTLEFRLAIEE